ncbi:MAG: hypothetical protein PWQ45_112 [Thermosipho sp. (in: thermotogales)]|jgi:transcriptional regulator with XRE-family HTH domain|nr:hypothetical protein [Thermosipho sp. (in: thermotogales)]
MPKRNKYEEWITEEGLELCNAWARNGLTDEDIAHNIGIGRTTLYEWKKKFPNFANALKTGKEVADIRVENALYKRALGYDIEETKTVIEKNGNSKDKTRVERLKKHIAPDTTAQIFWLKNRKPATWRDKQDLAINEPIKFEVDWGLDEEDED